MTTAAERIEKTPLSTDVRGSSVRVIIAADKYTVANVSPGMNDREEYARLFSAAPDLLSALKTLIERSGHISPFGTSASVKNIRLAGKYMEALDAAQAAIAKAEGRDP